MEFLLFLFFYILTHGTLALVSYYYKLFSNLDRDNYERSEIVDLGRIIPKQVLTVFESHSNLQYGIIVFFGTSVFAFLWTLLGDLLGTARYADEFPAYFFHSFFLPAVFFFLQPIAKSSIVGAFSKTHPLRRVFEQELPALGGVSVTLIASSFSSYGMYHEMMFIIIFINFIIICGLFLYKTKQLHDEQMHSYEEDDYREYYGDNTDNDLDFDEEPKY
jgi:uncharacterized membrane protein